MQPFFDGGARRFKAMQRLREEKEVQRQQMKKEREAIAQPTPATHAILTHLKAGECIRHSI